MSFIDFEHSNSPLLFRQPLSDAASLNPRTNSFGWSSPAASPTAQNNRGWPSFSGNSASTSAINSSFCGPRENIQERHEVTFQQRERRAQVSLSSDTPELLSPAYQYPENPKEDRHPRRSKDHDRRRNRSPREDKRANLYKTELCRSFEETGVCRYGGKCQFAHGHDEIRPRSQHPRYRTEICKTFHTVGTCPYGKRCRFIHLDGASPLWSSSYLTQFDNEYVDPLKTLEYSLDVDEYFKSLDHPLPLLSTGVSSETYSRREKDFQLEQAGPGESSQSRSQTTTTVSDSDDSSSTGYASSASDHDEEAENRQPAATFAVITSAEPKSVKQEEKEEEEEGSKQAGTTSDGDEDDEDVDEVTGRRLPIFRIIESHSGNVQAEDASKANVLSTANKVVDDEDAEYASSTTVEILSSKLLSHLQLSK